MASEIMSHQCEIRHGPWFNPSHRNLTLKERNVQSHFFNRKADNQTSKRPQFLRLDSTGEAGDSSPEIEEDLPRPHPDRSTRETGYNHHERKKRFNSFTQDFNLKTKKTSKRSSQYLQSNHTSAESKGIEFLEHLASQFNTFSFEQAAVSNSTISEMSEFCGMQRMACHQPMPNNTIPAKRGNPNLFQRQNPNMGQFNPFVNMPFMIPRSSVFHPQSAPGWNQPIRHSFMPRAPPPLPQQLNHQPWLNCGYPFQGTPRLPLNQTRFSFCPQGAQFTLFSSQPQMSNNNFTRKSNHPPRKTFNHRHSGQEKKHAKMFTKILQRPPQSHKVEMAKDCSHDKNISKLEVPQNNTERTIKVDRESCAKNLGNVDFSHNTDENVSSISHVNVTGQSEGSKPDKSLNTEEKESKDSKVTVKEDDSKVSRSRHSSIDFLLSGLNLKSSDGLSDSDFADCDWDMLDESNDTNDTWDEHFVSDDPYNPLTGWRCQKKVAVKSEDDRERPEWLCYSHEFDSGTESGSEDESDSDSDDWGGGPDDSLSRRTADGGTCEKESASTLSQKETAEKAEDQYDQTPTKISSVEKPPNQGNETTAAPADNSAKRKKSLHPSISYILGENGSSSDDFSDDESDDWDSFDDSDDDFAPSLLRREDLNLFQFSNNHFNPLTSFLSCNQGIRPELKNSPSVPCGPIFKPKARTVLISQRIICQVSDSPVSMVVPLEQSGKMSQNSVPTVQCSVVPSREQSFPNSCLRQLSPRTEKTSPKKVHFNNKATLIICPEPSHLVDEIKSTRRGPWLDYARDRCRFQHRIQHLEKMIGPCLSEEHRKKIAESRQLNDRTASPT